MNSTLKRAWPLLLALIGGALLGEAVWWSGVQVRTSSAPPGLHKRDMQLPHHLTALTGDLPPSPDAWSMSFHRTLFPGPEARLNNPTRVSGVAALPEAGHLEIYAAAIDGPQGIEGVGLTLDRLSPASAQVIQMRGGKLQVLPCSDALPAPGDGPVPFEVTPNGGGVSVTVSGTTTQCQVQAPPAGPMLRSGLRRVRVANLQVGDRRLPAPGPGGRAGHWVAGGLALAGLGLGLMGLGWSGGLVALCLAPVLLAGWLSGQELDAWAETARVLWLPVPWLPALLPAALSGGLLTIAGLGQILREGAPDWRLRTVQLLGLGLCPAMGLAPGPTWLNASLGLVGALVSGVVLIALMRALGSRSAVRSAAISSAVGSAAAMGVALTEPLGVSAILYAFVLGASLSALIWVNVNPHGARAYNSSAFILALIVIGCLEVVVRFTVAGQSWAGVRAGPMAMDIFSEVSNTQAEFSMFDAAEPTTYPSAGYPVRIPQTTGAKRVITAGSSSTGGAYQNDDLDDFYPARMQEILGPGYQVINQGVGGWTTFHIDRYLAAQIEALQPDIVTLYVGHNDQLTALPRPIAEIYEQLHSGSATDSVASGLSRYRLYQALRYTVASLRPAQARAAVPLSHARDNISRIITLVTSRGGTVILASEGLSPDPGPLLPYFQMLSKLAQAHTQVHFVDTAAALHKHPPASIFLDDSHLTDKGHRLVADMMTQAISKSAAQ